MRFRVCWNILQKKDSRLKDCKKSLLLIVSNDTIIMQPPYRITNTILKLVSSISEKIGEVNTRL